MGDGEEERVDTESELPAFQRSRQITDIFTNVQNILPDMDFSDHDENDEDSDSVEIVTRDYKPIVTHVSNKIEDTDLQDIDPHDDAKQIGEQKAEKEITELSVHTFIDSLVSQIAELPPVVKSNDYKLEHATDLDLDQLIDLLACSPDIQYEGDDHDSDVDTDSSTSTIVMDELERLAETYDTLDYNPVTPRANTPNNRPTTPNNHVTTPNNRQTTPKIPVPSPDNGKEEHAGSPDTVVLDLRPKTPESTTPRSASRRIVPPYLAKKLQRPSSSDSDEETEKIAWEAMRRNMKTTQFFSPKTASTGTLTEFPPSATNNIGISTQSSGVSTQSGGVSTQSGGVSTQIADISTRSWGVSTQNSNNDHSLEPQENMESERNVQGISRNVQGISRPIERTKQTKRRVKRTVSGNNNTTSRITSDIVAQSLSNENLTRKGVSQDSIDNKLDGVVKVRKVAWDDAVDNRVGNKNDIMIIEKETKRESETQTESEREVMLKRKKAEEEELKLKRIEEMRRREKRAAFRKRIEEQNRDPSTQLIFDVEESFTEKLDDIPSKFQQSSEQLLVLQLMIDNQGELSSLPPEYYSYCYSDIPTVSYYGTEGVLTWILTSPTKPFHVIAARLTFINNCLTYIFLVHTTCTPPPSSSSSSFYKDVGGYLSKHSIAQSDPQLFKSTLLNPRDYPFCEPLNKLFLLSKYNMNHSDLFTSQPAWFTYNLTLDKMNEMCGTKPKQRICLADLQANICPPTSTEFCVSTLSGDLLDSQSGLFHVLSSVRDTQLEISGLRLVQTDTRTDKQGDAGRTLCLVLSGYAAIARWSGKLGSLDTELALRTNPESVRAVLSQLAIQQFTLTNTRTSDKTRQELTRYFGYRFTETSPLRATELIHPLVFERSHDYVFLLVSPLISPSLLGEIVSVLQENGVSLLGIRRSRLNYRKCVGLGLSECQTKVFSKFNGTPLTSPSLSSSSGSTPGELDRQFFPQNFTTDASPSQPTLASTILFLSKRNGMYHSRYLIKELKSKVVDVNLSHTLQNADAFYSREQLSDPYLYFEMVPHSENSLWNVGGQFGLMPERKTFDFFMSHKQNIITEKCDLEQTVFVALIGKDVVASAGKEICDMIHFCDTLGVTCPDNETGHLELLGVKLIGKLNSFQAREVTQYEVGDSKWKSDIQYLQTVPVIALLVRAINAFQIVKQLHAHSDRSAPCKSRGYTRIMSETPEHAYKLASLLFFEKELYSDEIMRPKQLHLPPPRTHVNSILSKEGRHHLSDLPDRLVYQSEGILKSMLAPPRLLASLLLTSQVQHFGKILKRLEQEEFTIVGLYLSRDTDSAVICVQAENCIYKLTQLEGPRNLKEAKASHQFSLRASFASHPDSFHASQTYEESVVQVKRYFPDGLCCHNTLDMQAEGIPHSYIDTLVPTASSRRYVSRPHHLKPLLQTVCVVFPPDLLRPAKHMRLSPASQLITLIQNCQFEVVNMRLLTIPCGHIQNFRSLFKVHYELSQTFVNRPCLVLALQRENAASCFAQILQGYSNANNKKLLNSYEHMMLASTNKQTCEEQIKFFFDFLSHRCKDEIKC